MQMRIFAVTAIAASVMLALRFGELAFRDSVQSQQPLPSFIAQNMADQPITLTATTDQKTAALLLQNMDAATGQIAEKLVENKDVHKSDPNDPIYQTGEELSQTKLDAGADNSDAKAALLKRIEERQQSTSARDADNVQQRLLQAAEDKLTSRIEALKKAQGELDQALIQKRNEEEAQFAGLVKMYETMRPKNAARIFNNLEISVLLDLSKRMKPRIMAEIMSYMEPSSAQALTVAIARGASPASTETNGSSPLQAQQDVTGSTQGDISYDNLPKIGG